MKVQENGHDIFKFTTNCAIITIFLLKQIWKGLKKKNLTQCYLLLQVITWWYMDKEEETAGFTSRSFSKDSALAATSVRLEFFSVSCLFSSVSLSILMHS